MDMMYPIMCPNCPVVWDKDEIEKKECNDCGWPNCHDEEEKVNLLVILKMLPIDYAKAIIEGKIKIGHFQLDQFCHTDDDGFLKVFPTLEDAMEELESEEIDGQIVELPIY